MHYKLFALALLLVGGLLITTNTAFMSSSAPSLQGIVSQMTGATSGVAGTSGSTPTPAAGKQTSFLRGDATFASAATVSTGSPNGVVTGNPGDIYLDSVTSFPYIKATGTNTNTGWVQGLVTVPSPTTVPNGGTGRTAMSDINSVVVSGATLTTQLTTLTMGGAGTVLTSNGVGSLPSFQTTAAKDYMNASLTTNSNVANGAAVPFTTLTSSGVTNSGGTFTLLANKTYLLRSTCGINASGAAAAFQWRNVTTNTLIGNSGRALAGNAMASVTYGGVNTVEAIVVVTTSITVRVENTEGSTKNFSGAAGVDGQSVATIIQL